MTENEEVKDRYKPFSNKRMMGFSLGGVILSMMWGVRAMVQLYAEKALKLPILTVFIIISVYAIWDAVNDPLSGWVLDRSKRFTAKKGKRFSWIIIGIIGSLLFLILLYLPISFDPLVAAVWLLFTLILWDQFQTFFELSSTGLIVDIFRDKHQRVKYGFFFVIFAAIASLIRGIGIPLILDRFGGETSPWAYLSMSILFVIILVILMIPYGYSISEPDEMIQLRSRLDEEGKSSSPFKNIMKRVFSDKNWMSLILANSSYVIFIQCLTVGIFYYAIDGLGLEVGSVAIFNVMFLVMQFISVPLWLKITNRIGAKNAFTSALLIFVIVSVLFALFGWTFLPALLIGMLFGIGNAGQGVALAAVISETIDNASVQSGKREESSYMGVLRFFTATGIFWQVLIFLLVGMATGYDATVEYDYAAGIVPSQQMIIGLNLQISLIPGMILLITTLIYYKLNIISKEVAIENKNKLLKMDL